MYFTYKNLVPNEYRKLTHISYKYFELCVCISNTYRVVKKYDNKGIILWLEK